MNIAFYLPQYHPIPENDEWWEPGFTEWTNVTKARPLFPGHYQPILPSELGFYDLRLDDVRVKQAALAAEYGISGFCYWHYWFSGKRLLQTPGEMLLMNKSIDFPFCLAWANASWTGIWHGAPNRVLQIQNYPGIEDIVSHLTLLRDYFDDTRYIRVGGKPLLVIFRPIDIPNVDSYIGHIREQAMKLGMGELHIVGIYGDGAHIPVENPFDGFTIFNLHKLRDMNGGLLRNRFHRLLTTTPVLRKVRRSLSSYPDGLYRYADAVHHFVEDKVFSKPYYPCVIPGFDNTARSGTGAFILNDTDPELFRLACRAAQRVNRQNHDLQSITFIKSWNEWAEGNVLEPDRKFGRSFLKVVADELS